MQDREKEKLFKRTSEYISIGITQDGNAKATIAIPWETTAQAYNMCIPDVYITPEDLDDQEIMNKILDYKVIGCYIWASLSDYMFISDFSELQDLSIMCGDRIRNLDFLAPLNKCRMLFLSNAQLDNIDGLIKLNRRNESIFGGLRCVGLLDCNVKDLSAFDKEEHYFTEFLVWESKGEMSKNRWDKIKAAKKRYLRIN